MPKFLSDGIFDGSSTDLIVDGSFRSKGDLNYFGLDNTINKAEIVINTGNVGSPQIGFTENGDASWAIGVDDVDNGFKIHGNASATIPTINGLTNPFFEIDSIGQIFQRPPTGTGSYTKLGFGVSTQEVALELGDDRTGSGYAYIDLIGDTTYADYGLRLIRWNGGANTNSHLRHRGTGYLEIETEDGGNILINPNSGNVGIFETNPSQKLHVNGSARITGAIYDSNNSPGTSGQVLSSTATGTDWIDGSAIPGVPDGSGTAGKIVMWQDSDTLTDSKITQTAGGETNYVDIDFANVEDLTITGDSSFSTFTVNSFYAVNFSNIENNFNVGSGDLSIATGDASMSLGTTTTDSDTLTVGYETTRFIGTGNVGIGTTSPAAKLEVEGGDHLLQVSSLSATGNPYISFNQQGVRRSFIQHNDSGDYLKLASEYGGISFFTGTGGTETQKMTILSGGDVGIGDTSPDAKLTVFRSDSTYAINLSNTEARAGLSVKSSSSFDSKLTISSGASSRQYIQAVNNDATTGRDIVLNPYGGNVGIGTTSNGQKLSVAPDTDVSAEIGKAHIGQVGFNGYAGFSHVDQNTQQGYALIQYSDGSTYMNANTGKNIRFRIGNSDKMILNSSGKVGIGTTSPNQKLTIKGTDQYVAAEQTNYVWGGTTTIGVRMGTDATAGLLDFRRWVGSATTHGTALITQVNSDGGYGLDFRVDTKTSNTVATTSRMFLSQSGEVGIGTTSPQSKLHVSSGAVNEDCVVIIESDTDNNDETSNPRLELRQDGGAVIGRLGYRDNTNSLELINQYAEALYLGTNNSTDLTILSSGYVGIGTTSPSEKLTISGGNLLVAGDYQSLYVGGKTDSSQDGIRMSIDNAGNGYFDHRGAGNLNFRVDASNGATTRMVIEDTGNVGIGTTSPAAKLEVEGGDHLFQISTSSSTGNPYMSFNQAGTRRSFIQHADSGDTLKLVSEYGGIDFYTGTSGSETEKMTIESGGNVGIGTNSPDAILHASKSSANADVPIILENSGQSGTSTASLVFAGNGGGGVEKARIKAAVYGDGYMSFHNNDDSEKMRIAANGNVGIGQTNPSTYKLDVSGTIRATGDVIAYSDIRVKENITTIEKALDKVKKLRGVEYNKIDNTEKSIGVIAQEIEEVIPEVVREDDQGMKSVAYGNITAVLIEAIKEQQNQIDELKNQLDAFTK